MKTFIGNAGGTCSKVSVSFTFSKYELEIAIAELLRYDILPTNRYAVEKELRKLLERGGFDYFDLYWGKYGEENLYMSQKFGKNLYPEFYIEAKVEIEPILS